MKTVLKVLYISILLIVGVIMFVGFYNTYQTEGYVNVLKNSIAEADETGDYTNLFRAFSIYGTPLDKDPVIKTSTGNNENNLVVYSSVNQYCYKYMDGEDTVSGIRVEDVYLLAVVHPVFDDLPDSNGNNPSGLEFIGDNGASYVYKFELSSEYNSSEYASSPTSEKECTLNAYCYGSELSTIVVKERTELETYDDFDLIFVPLSESLLNFIKDEIGATSIAALNIVDNSNAEVFGEDVAITMDFSQTFYADVQEFVNDYNLVQDYSNYSTDSGYTKAEAEEVSEKLNTFMDDPDSYIAGYTSKYIQGYLQDDIYNTTQIIWTCIGITALYLVVVAIVYILLFHFKQIKSFVRRLAKKEVAEDHTPRIPKPVDLDMQPKPVLTASGVKRHQEEKKEPEEPKAEAEAPAEAEASEPDKTE